MERYIVLNDSYYSFIMYGNGSLLYYESLSNDLISAFFFIGFIFVELAVTFSSLI